MVGKNKRIGRNPLRKSASQPKIKSKSKTLDGINFRSMLEAFMYRKLKEAHIKNDYEKVKYVLLEGFYYEQDSYENTSKTGFVNKKDYKVRDITYTPDFVDPNGKWIIECKGYANERFPLKWKMFKKLLMEQESPPVLFVPRNQKDCLRVVDEILKL